MSFGTGDSPSGTSFQTQFTRDAPQIEGAKLGLMDTAQQYTRFGTNPWELADKDAELGDDLYGKYRYQGIQDPTTGIWGPQGADDHRWDPTGGEAGTGQGRLFGDLTRGERATEGQAGGLGGVPTQQVAGFDPMQQKAFNQASGGIGSYQQYLDKSKDFATKATQQYDPTGQTPGQTGYQDYMNPYQGEVIGAIESQFDKAQNLQNLQAGQAGAFGGARQGVQAAELTGQRAQTVGTAQAQNYGQAQAQAQQQFGSQMGRYGEAAQMMAGLGGQQQQQQLGDIASLMSAGSVQQQRSQQGLDAQYQQQLQQLYEPYQRLGFTSDIYQGMPSSAMAVSMGTSPGSNPLAQAVGTGITGLAAYQGFQNQGG